MLTVQPNAHTQCNDEKDIGSRQEGEHTRQIALAGQSIYSHG